MKRTKKRLVVISDLHCGSVVGLTPPDWQQKFVKNDRIKRNKYATLQSQCWDFYDATIQSLKPIDILVVNGDMIDGKSEKDGGLGLIESDRQGQAEMASESIMRASAKNIILTYGTSYHVSSDGEDFENLVKEYVKADSIGAHAWCSVNGLMFDFKHHLGSSSVPYGRFTAISRDYNWNVLWSEREEQPKSKILCRSHVHYFGYAGNKDFLGITTPALQSLGTRFGSRRCSGTVDFGLIVFDVYPDGSYTWKPLIADIVSHRARAMIL